MDDRKIIELERLRLAYNKQLIFIASLIIFTFIGLLVYVFNIISYNFGLLMSAIVIIVTGVIGIMTIDEKMKTISRRIKEL